MEICHLLLSDGVHEKDFWPKWISRLAFTCILYLKILVDSTGALPSRYCQNCSRLVYISYIWTFPMLQT